MPNRGKKGTEIVEGRVCAWRVRNFIENESSFLITRLLSNLEETDNFIKAFKFAEKARAELRKQELLQRQKELQEKLKSISNQFDD